MDNETGILMAPAPVPARDPEAILHRLGTLSGELLPRFTRALGPVSALAWLEMIHGTGRVGSTPAALTRLVQAAAQIEPAWLPAERDSDPQYQEWRGLLGALSLAATAVEE